VKINKYIFCALVIFTLDRLTKIAALAWWLHAPRQIMPFLSLEVTFNRGIS